MIPTSITDALARHELDDALRAALDHFGCQAGTVHVLEDGVLKLRASHGIPPQVTAIVATVPIGKGIAGLAAERLAPVTICNLQTDTSGQARPGARQTGMEGSLAVPMLDDAGALRGVLGIAKAEAYDWPEAETQQALAVAAEFARSAA